MWKAITEQKLCTILGDCDTHKLSTIYYNDVAVSPEFQMGAKEFVDALNSGTISHFEPLTAMDCGQYGNRLLYIDYHLQDGHKRSIMSRGNRDEEMRKFYDFLTKNYHISTSTNKHQNELAQLERKRID